jgi:hypothetical protein
VRWPGQAADSAYRVNDGATTYAVTSDADGYVNYSLGGAGSHIVELLDPDETALMFDNDGPGWASAGSPLDNSTIIEPEPMYGERERYAPAEPEQCGVVSRPTSKCRKL